jgi:hypothetical protein
VLASREPIASLIERHAEAHRVALKADEIANALWNVPGRVEPPFVTASEFSPVTYPLGQSKFHGLDEINNIIDRYNDSRHRHFEWMSVAEDGETPIAMSPERAERLAKQIQHGEDERAKLTALFESRRSVYRKWRIDSGVEAADAECDTLWEAKYALHDQIINFRCETIDDVRTKAAWLVEQFGDELSSEASHRVMQQFASIGQEAL